jgi:hypothetical protein
VKRGGGEGRGRGKRENEEGWEGGEEGRREGEEGERVGWGKGDVRGRVRGRGAKGEGISGTGGGLVDNACSYVIIILAVRAGPSQAEIVMRRDLYRCSSTHCQLIPLHTGPGGGRGLSSNPGLFVTPYN